MVSGKTPAELKALAVKAGVFTPTMRAGELVAWLAREFDLGHGYAIAVWAAFKRNGWVRAPGRK
jgi:hypothetical protein